MSFINTLDGNNHHFSGAEAARNRYNINVIANALGKINRFSGHTRRPYSVAEHSLLVADILASNGHGPIVQLAGLMHDAHEAFVGDISSPVKTQLGERWRIFEAREEHYLRHHFGLVTVFQKFAAEIKNADLIALATERRDLLNRPASSMPWPVLDTPGEEIHPWHSAIDGCHSYVLRGHDVFPWHHFSSTFLATYTRLSNAAKTA